MFWWVFGLIELYEIYVLDVLVIILGGGKIFYLVCDLWEE